MTTIDNPLISAKAICSSVNKDNTRLLSIELTSVKWLDAEFEKHRMISSNSSSSRAIPFKRSLDRDVFIPLDIRYNEKGMQGHKQLEQDGIDYIYFKALAEELYEKSVDICKIMDKEIDLHKQHINRFLEPWTVQKKLATANEEWWYAFLELRDSPAADPAIQDLARKIRLVVENTEPTFLYDSEWHLPYVDNEELKSCDTLDNIKRSVARSARVSYDNFSGETSSFEQDSRLHDSLLEMKHFSCFEHQGKACDSYVNPDKSITEIFGSLCLGNTHITKTGKVMSGNINGFVQYRQLVE